MMMTSTMMNMTATMKTKKVPLRKCVITGEQLPKKDLIRVVRTTDGQVQVDLTGRMNGRGAYLKKDRAVIEKARLSKALNRHLEVEVLDDVYSQLLELV